MFIFNWLKGERLDVPSRHFYISLALDLFGSIVDHTYFGHRT